MGFKVTDKPAYGSLGEDGNNITDWRYRGFSSADLDNGDLDHNRLGTHQSNTWNVQGYFENEPTIRDDDKGCSIYDGGLWYIEGTDAEFSITYPDMNESQTALHTTAHNPDDNDEGNFSFDISAGLGPISVGLSRALYEGVDLTNDSYEETTWKFDYGITGADIPTDQDDSVGVRWDYEAESSTGWFTALVKQQYSFRVVHHCSGPRTVYSSTPDLWHWHNIEIVDT